VDEVDEATALKSRVIDRVQAIVPDGKIRVTDWTDDNENLFKALKTEKIVMFVVLALAIGVAAFNLLSTLAMLVADKRGEIAILRTLGMSKSRIVLAFFTHGGVIGVTGVGIGTVLGIALASNVATVVAWLEKTLGFKILPPDVYYISDIPAKIEHQDIILTVVIGLLLCLLAPLYPAYNASRVEPAQVLRYE
ncbi:MAG: FtsX-like permease family protein, partial [Gammaproteobacteria bacterium]